MAVTWKPRSTSSSTDCVNPLYPDPNIAGIGVTAAFLLSASIVLLFSIVSFYAGLIPDPLVNILDRRFYRARIRGNPAASRAFQKGVRAFSDQQIVTGIAILVAGFIGLKRDISTYHWQIIVYLAWTSSNVHLMTLTLLRDFFRANSFVKWWRVLGMVALFVLLIIALVPTTSLAFVDSANSELWRWMYANDSLKRPTGIAARCFWGGSAGGMGYVDPLASLPDIDGVISIAVLCISYVWKMTQLFDTGSGAVHQWIRSTPGRLMKRGVRRMALSQREWPSWTRYIPFNPYAVVVGLYAIAVAIVDFAESTAASIWFMTFSLGWGTLKVAMPRQSMAQMYPSIVARENVWDFGQFLPLFLVLLPVLTAIESFRKATKHLAVADSSQYRAPRDRPHSRFESTGPSAMARAADDEVLSDLFRSMRLDRTHEFGKTRHNVSLEHQYLYSSKAFTSLLVLINLYLMTIIALVWAAQTSAIANLVAKASFICSIATAALFLHLFFWIGFVVPYSRLSR